MSEIEEVTMDPVRWPIAPDGYIPNSTIRSWSRGGRSLGVVKGWDDICFPEDYSSDEDDSGRVFWLGDDDEDEEEITFRVKRRRKEEDDGKDRGDEMGSEDENEMELEEEKKDEMKRRFPPKRPLDLQTTTQRNHEVGKMRQEAGPTYSSRTLENILPTSSHGNRPEPREDVKVPEVVTSPPQYRPEPRRTPSFIPEPPEPLVQRPLATTDHFIPKQSYCRQQDSVQELPRPQARDTRIKKTAKPRFTAGPPTAEPRDWTPQHQESEPSISEDPQPQPDPDPPEDKRFLLSAAKYDNVVDCDYACLDSKVLRVYKDRNRNMSRRGKLSQPPNAPKVIRYTAGVRLVDGLRNASARAKSSTVQTRPSRVRHPNGGRRRLLRPDSAQSVQTFTYSEDQMDLEPEPELTSLQGFCPASQTTTNPPVTVKPSNVEQLVASMTAVQLGQAPAPQPAVQRIEMKETQALSPAHFHYLILLASQRNVFALDPCGETPRGNMQVDWMALTCCS